VEVVEEVEEVVGDVEEVVDVGFNVEEESLHLPKDEDFRDLLSGLDGK